MQLTVIGVNHQTAPLSIREKLAFAAAELPDAVGSLIDSDAALEAVILSTCNRSEIYAVGGDAGQLARWLAAHKHTTPDALETLTFHYRDRDAIHHIYRVASGLDSLILGEPQILG